MSSLIPFSAYPAQNKTIDVRTHRPSLSLRFGRSVSSPDSFVSISPQQANSGIPSAKTLQAPEISVGSPPLKHVQLPPHYDSVLGEVQIYRFSNGLRLYALPRHEVPQVVLGELCHVGAANETSHESGWSHFIEHLDYKGTPTLKPGEFDRRLENMGAGSNALTGHDYTFHYMHNIPKEGLQEAIRLRSDIFQNAWIPQEELDKERKAVLEEMQEHKNDKLYKAHRKLYKSLWPDSPYSRKIIGSADNIKKVTREELLNYRSRHYRPDNCAIIAVGDFELPQLLNLIATHYNHPFPPKGAEHPATMGRLKRPKDAEPLKTRNRDAHTVIEDPDVKAVNTIYGFDGPRPDHPNGQRNVLVAEMMSLILGGDESSRLHQKLVEEEQIATSVDMDTDSFKKRSGIFINFECEPANREKVAQRIREILDEVMTNGVTPQEVNKCKVLMKSNLASMTETNQSIFSLLASALGDDALDASFGKGLKLMETITADDIREAANRYLKPEACKSVSLVPKAAEVADKDINAASSLEASGIGRLGKAVPKVHFGGALHPMDQAVKLFGKTELIVREKKGALSTSITMHLRGDGRVDTKGIPGLLDYLADWLERGTTRHSATELQKLLAEKGMGLDISAGVDNLTIRMQGLTESAEEMFKILSDVLNRPAFKTDDLDFVKKQRKDLHQNARDLDPNYELSELLTETLYPEKHPYGASEQRIIDAAPKATPERLRKAYRQLLHPSNMTISVSGGAPPEKVRSWSEALLKQRPFDEIPALDIKADRIVTCSRNDLKQAEIRKTWSAPDAYHPDRFAMLLLDSILSSGMSSRIFRRFREQEDSLCYTASTYYEPRLNGGHFSFGIGTDPKNLTKVQEVWQEVLEATCTTPPTTEEMQRAVKAAKANLLAKGESSSFTSRNTASHRAFDLPSPDEIAKGLEAVTAEQVREAAVKYLKQPSLTTIMAPKETLREHGLPNPQQTDHQAASSPIPEKKPGAPRQS